MPNIECLKQKKNLTAFFCVNNMRHIPNHSFKYFNSLSKYRETVGTSWNIHILFLHIMNPIHHSGLLIEYSSLYKLSCWVSDLSSHILVTQYVAYILWFKHDTFRGILYYQNQNKQLQDDNTTLQDILSVCSSSCLVLDKRHQEIC